MKTESAADKELLPYPFGSIRDILTALFRQKIKILLIFVVTFSTIIGWVYSKETLYEAEATILLKFGREHIFRPEVGDVDQIVRFNEIAAVESERKILESRDLVQRAVETIGVQNIYPDLIISNEEVQPWQVETASLRFLGNLTSSGAEGTNVIEIGFSHQSPQVAAMALNVLIDVLQEKHLQVFSDPKSSFLIQRLEAYQKNLEQAEDVLQDFKRKHDLASPLEDQQRRLLDQRSQLDTNNKTIKNQLQGLVGRISSLTDQMKTVSKRIPLSTTEGGGMVAKAKADLFALRRQEQGLLARYTEASGPVQNIREEIELVEEFIRTQKNSEGDKSVTSGKNPVFQNLEVEHLKALSELKTLQASNEVIARQISDLDKKIQRLDSLQEELIGLDRKRATAEENYKLYLKKVEEAKVSDEMNQLKMSNISVIQAADTPRRPSGRPKSRQLLFGFIFSTIMSLGMAFVIEYLQGGYARPDQAAEDLGLPILASFNQKG
ncbi:GumC family protein [Candidatus Nitrospira salsa]